MLFVGLVACRRLAFLQEAVRRIVVHTKTPFELVVSEDSEDPATIAWCRGVGVRIIYGPNRGCRWNKNRLLRYYERFSKSEIVALIEDDTRVWEDCWERSWIKACYRWGHINWAMLHEDPGPRATWRSPRFTHRIGGQCTMTTSSVFKKVGYIDPRFNGYGYEHVEWSMRHGRVLNWPCDSKSAPCFNSHVGALYEQTSFDEASLNRNKQIMETLVACDPSVYRKPWVDDTERIEMETQLDRARTQQCSSMADLIASMSRLPMPDQ